MSDKQINKILKTIRSCKNEEHVHISMEWINRLKDELYFSRKDLWLINNEFIDSINIIKETSDGS